MTTGRMTLRVSHDGGRTYGPVREVQVDPRKAVILATPVKYPPCGCHRCTGRLSPGGAMSGPGRWLLRHIGRYAGPLYLSMIVGSLALVLAGTLAIR